VVTGYITVILLTLLLVLCLAFVAFIRYKERAYVSRDIWCPLSISYITVGVAELLLKAGHAHISDIYATYEGLEIAVNSL